MASRLREGEDGGKPEGAAGGGGAQRQKWQGSRGLECRWLQPVAVPTAAGPDCSQCGSTGGAGAEAEKPWNASEHSIISQDTGAGGQPITPLAPTERIRQRASCSSSEAVRKYHRSSQVDAKQRQADHTFVCKLARCNTVIEDVAPSFVRVLDWWARLEEPPRHGTLASMLSHSRFGAVISTIIFANAVFTAYDSNYVMDNMGETSSASTVLELLFMLVYVFELVAKLCVHRLYFFCNNEMLWNIFDFMLVLFSFGDCIMLLAGGNSGNVTFARSVRLFKLGRILRIFRAMSFLKELRVMLASIVGSFYSLMWSVVMITVIIYIFALLFIQQMTDQLVETWDSKDSEMWVQQRHYFRNVERTMLTLFEATMGGLDWDTAFELIQPLGPFYVFAFIFYIAFFNFAVLNILTGIFVENAMKLCQPDGEELEAEARRRRERDIAQLTLLAEAMDADQSGTIKKSEFMDIVQSQEMGVLFSRLGIDIKDPEVFFHAITEAMHQDEVPIHDFVTKTIHFKGAASNLDLYGLIRQAASMRGLDGLVLQSGQVSRSVKELRRHFDVSLLAVEARIAAQEKFESAAGAHLSALDARLAAQEGLGDLLGGIRDVLSSSAFGAPNQVADDFGPSGWPTPVLDTTSRL
eukprot:CAMPEP_0170207948 /NCGR_PEP_ID=MMETSP0116_2-20130129/3553_1 /TAXON_ID=400756 /ORGANISM="Durinskia baltica, Strain CSIRO CS-38" /LENGTH=636 /DNA_ID=CAMNT_0010458409 /DNA_START=167 /DNA_END=2077 /DNA_ORIENTATION=+